MGLIRLAALGALGFLGYRYMEKAAAENNEAFAEGEGGPAGATQIRNAGPDAMADEPSRDWTKTDEELDETFPASDPPANY